MLNSVNLIGRLVKEPDAKEFRDDQGKEQLLVRYRLAVERDYKTGDKRPVDYISCSAFGSAARYVRDYIHQGDMVAVTGRIAAEKYQKEGQEDAFYVGVQVKDNYLVKQKGEPGRSAGRELEGLPPLPE